jgi:phosphoribosylformylglycinamidine synthase
MVGIIDDIDHVTTAGFADVGDDIVLLGENTAEIGGSEYLKVIHGIVAGDAPAIDLMGEKRLQAALLQAIRDGDILSAHDVAEGGLAVALAESAIADPDRPLGIDVQLTDDLPTNALLYGEAQSRVVISCDASRTADLLRRFAAGGVEARRIGRVGALDGNFRVSTGDATMDVPVAMLVRAYYDAIPSRMDRTPIDVATALESEVHAD